MTPKQSFGKKTTTLIGVVTVVLLLAGLAVSIWLPNRRADAKRSRAQIQKRLDAIRAAGQPVTIQDVAKFCPDPPPEHDAGKLLAKAFALLSIPESVDGLRYFGYTNFSRRDAPLDEPTKIRVEEFLGQNQAVFDVVPWDALTNAWIGVGYSNGFPAKEPGFNPHDLTQLTKLLELSAVYQAEMGRAPESARRLQQSLAVDRVLRNNRFLHYLVRRTGEQRAVYTLERMVNRTEFSDADLLMLEDSLADSRPESLREEMMTLRCVDIWSMESVLALVGDGFLSPDDFPEGRTIPLKRGLSRAVLSLSGKLYEYSDYIDILDLRTRQIDALTLPMKQRMTELQRIVPKHAGDPKHETLAHLGTMPANDIMPKGARDDASILAELQVAGTALAIERWRLGHEKRLPESLSELVPDYLSSVPLDSFDDQPLRYKKLERGYLVYSIGSDFKDDGGKERPAGADDWFGYDITFRVER